MNDAEHRRAQYAVDDPALVQGGSGVDYQHLLDTPILIRGRRAGRG